jgi:drug/metabolite transporter (DMT)-like permease
LPLLYGGVLSTGVAYTLQILGQRGVQPSRAAIIFSLESLFAALSEAVFLGEAMTLRKYIGGAVIFAGVLLSQFASAERRREQIPSDKAA